MAPPTLSFILALHISLHDVTADLSFVFTANGYGDQQSVHMTCELLYCYEYKTEFTVGTLFSPALCFGQQLNYSKQTFDVIIYTLSYLFESSNEGDNYCRL